MFSGRSSWALSVLGALWTFYALPRYAFLAFRFPSLLFIRTVHLLIALPFLLSLSFLVPYSMFRV